MSQPDFLIPFLKEMRKRKVHTAIESALYVDTEILESVIPLVDLIYADFKIFDSKTHKNTQVCVMNVSKAISVCCWKVRRGIV